MFEKVAEFDVVRTQVTYGVRMIGRRQVLFVVPHADFFEIGANELVCLSTMWTGSYALINSTLTRNQVNLNNYRSICSSGFQAAQQFLYELFFLTSKLLSDGGGLFIFFIHCCPPKFENRRFLWRHDSVGRLIEKKTGEERPYDIDIGAGFVELMEADDPANYMEAAKVRPDIVKCSNRFTASRETVGFVKGFFLEHGIRASVGLEFPAARAHNLVQVTSENFPTAQILQLELVLGRFSKKDFIRILSELVDIIS